MLAICSLMLPIVHISTIIRANIHICLYTYPDFQPAYARAVGEAVWPSALATADRRHSARGMYILLYMYIRILFYMY